MYCLYKRPQPSLLCLTNSRGKQVLCSVYKVGGIRLLGVHNETPTMAIAAVAYGGVQVRERPERLHQGVRLAGIRHDFLLWGRRMAVVQPPGEISHLSSRPVTRASDNILFTFSGPFECLREWFLCTIAQKGTSQIFEIGRLSRSTDSCIFLLGRSLDA